MAEIADGDGDLEAAGDFSRLGEAPAKAVAAVFAVAPIGFLAIERDVLGSAPDLIGELGIGCKEWNERADQRERRAR